MRWKGRGIGCVSNPSHHLAWSPSLTLSGWEVLRVYGGLSSASVREIVDGRTSRDMVGVDVGLSQWDRWQVTKSVDHGCVLVTILGSLAGLSPTWIWMGGGNRSG